MAIRSLQRSGLLPSLASELVGENEMSPLIDFCMCMCEFFEKLTVALLLACITSVVIPSPLPVPGVALAADLHCEEVHHCEVKCEILALTRPLGAVTS